MTAIKSWVSPIRAISRYCSDRSDCSADLRCRSNSNVCRNCWHVRCRIGEESFGIVGPFHNAAIFKQDHLVGDGSRELHFVRHDEHGLAGIGEFEHHVEHFAHHFRIERGGDFVEQQHFRMQDQRTADGHALTLAAGKLVRPGILAVGKADAFQKPDRLLLDCGLISLLHQGRRSVMLPSTVLLGNRS